MSRAELARWAAWNVQEGPAHRCRPIRNPSMGRRRFIGVAEAKARRRARVGPGVLGPRLASGGSVADSVLLEAPVELGAAQAEEPGRAGLVALGLGHGAGDEP